jgi:hypothetical protein
MRQYGGQIWKPIDKVEAQIVIPAAGSDLAIPVRSSRNGDPNLIGRETFEFRSIRTPSWVRLGRVSGRSSQSIPGLPNEGSDVRFEGRRIDFFASLIPFAGALANARKCLVQRRALDLPVAKPIFCGGDLAGRLQAACQTVEHALPPGAQVDACDAASQLITKSLKRLASPRFSEIGKVAAFISHRDRTAP